MGEDVAGHYTFELAFGRTGRQVQYCIKGINLEEVPVGAARRGGPTIADSAEIGRAMYSSVGQGLLGQDIFFEACYIGRDVIDDPVHPRTHRGIRVIVNQGNALSSYRYGRPL